MGGEAFSIVHTEDFLPGDLQRNYDKTLSFQAQGLWSIVCILIRIFFANILTIALFCFFVFLFQVAQFFLTV